MSKYWINSYYKDRDEYRWTKEQRSEDIRDWYLELKNRLSCMKCPERRAICLDFHHKIPGEKDFNLSQAIRDGYSKERIIEEIRKCEVLCAYCHRVKHEEIGIVNGRNLDNPKIDY